MIVDPGGRVFVLSSDLQPPPLRIGKGGGASSSSSDAFVAALQSTAQTGPLVQRLVKAVHAEVERWGDRLVDWQQSLCSLERAREAAAARAAMAGGASAHSAAERSFADEADAFLLGGDDANDDEGNTTVDGLHHDGASMPTLVAPSVPSYLRADQQQMGTLMRNRSRMAFLVDNQWVLLRDFLISCCDPVCRTEVLNEYRVSSSSLSAAEAEGRYSVGDMRTVIIYFAVMSASRSLRTGERSVVMAGAKRDHSQWGGDDNNNTHTTTTSTSSSCLYSNSPLSSFDAVVSDILASALVSGATVHHHQSGPSHSSSGAAMIALLQRHLIVGRGGHSVPLHLFEAIGGGIDRAHHYHRHGGVNQQRMASSAALAALFVPRPIEAALHAQGKDGRLKIVLRRKVGLWHQLLADDEAAEAKRMADHKKGILVVSGGDGATHTAGAMSATSRALGAHAAHQQRQESMAVKQLQQGQQLAPPLRNYLCCSSKTYLEYLVSQMPFLFSPIVLASSRDLQAPPLGAGASTPLGAAGCGGDDVDIDIDDLFGTSAAPPHPSAAHASPHRFNALHGRGSGMAQLLALLGGSVTPQMVFSDAEGKHSSAAEEQASSSSSAPTDAAGAGPSARVPSALGDPNLLAQRLGQLSADDADAAADVASSCADPAHSSSSSLLDRLSALRAKAQAATNLTIASSSNPAAKGNGSAAPQQGTAAAAAGGGGGNGTVVFCAEIKPNALRELRAILHDRYSINVDCYFDFLSEEGQHDAKKPSPSTADKTKAHAGGADGGASGESSDGHSSDRGEMAVPNFKLKPGVALRPYQKASLERFCQDERKVFHQQEGDGDGDPHAEDDEAIDEGEGKVSEEERRRKAQAKEDAYNASLTGGTHPQPQGSVIPPPTRRIAHHGIVVLPCGAGKTLTGIAASAMVGRRTIVMCINVLSVLQWRDQFLKWTCLRPEQVTVCTRDLKQIPSDVFITTYSMLTAQQPTGPAAGGRGGRRGAQSTDGGAPPETENSRLKKLIMKEISETAWGMLVLDEVHVAPASCFQTVVDRVKYHCILGLSATLLREDMGIDKLRYLVGPKLYEANWLELTRAGNLAPVMCAEVRCPLPPSMLKQYLMHKGGYAAEAQSVMRLEKGGKGGRRGGGGADDDGDDEDGPAVSSRRMQVDIECINPYKLWCTQALVAFHESRSPPDKTIIFCDSVPAAHFYAKKLGIPFMDRSAKDTERSHMLKYFTHSGYLNTIILTRVGDIALDLPEATVVIQISGLFASQRQEAQRLGRILRPKPPSLDHGMSFFYSLVSDDTSEVEAAANRQAWLRDQGYTYRMLQCEDILSYYGTCRELFINNELPSADGGTTAGAGRRGGTVGPLGTASPFSRPLACVGSPRWYYRVPVQVSTVTGGGAAPSPVAAAASANTDGLGVTRSGTGRAVLRLKRQRDDAEEGGDAAVAAASPAAPSGAVATTTSTIRWMWVPFTDRNSLMLEKSFVAGHHNANPRLHLNNLGSATHSPDHPPLYLGHCERVPLATATRTRPCAAPVRHGPSSSSLPPVCHWESVGVLGSCKGPHTAPSSDAFQRNATDPFGAKAKAGRKAQAMVAAAKSLSAAADGSGGCVFFDTSDLPCSHGEWTVTVQDEESAESAGKRRTAKEVAVATTKNSLMKLLLPAEHSNPSRGDASAAPLGGRAGRSAAAVSLADHPQVLRLRIRRGRGPLEVQEGSEGSLLLNDDSALAMLMGGGEDVPAKAEVVKTEDGAPCHQPHHHSSSSSATRKTIVDIEAECTSEWNMCYAFGDASPCNAARGRGGPDEHDCCSPSGGIVETSHTVLGRLLPPTAEPASSSALVEGRRSLSCVQHFSHEELGQRKNFK